MPLSPETLAILAKKLADVSGAFAKGNPAQEALSGILSDSTAGLVKATQFNKSQAELERKLLNIVNKAEDVPQTDVAFGLPESFNGNGRSALTIPGTPEQPSRSLLPSQFPEPKTLEEAGIAPGGRVSPFQALGLGAQGTQEAIALEQTNRRFVQQELTREKDIEAQFDLLDRREKNRIRAAEERLKNQRDVDIERRGPEIRAGQILGTGLRNVQLGEEIVGGPTVPERREATELQLRRDEAATTTAESSASISQELRDLELEKAQQAVTRSPSDISRIRITAERAITPNILATLSDRLGADALKPQLLFFKSPDALNEGSRSFNFAALIRLLTKEELVDVNKEFSKIVNEIQSGGQPSDVMQLGARFGLGTADNPSINPIDEVSIQNAVGAALSEDDLLKF